MLLRYAVYLVSCLVIGGARLAAADPYHFLPFDNSVTSEVLTPNTTDTLIGEYSWDATEKTDGAVSLRTKFNGAGWSYVLNINTLNGGNYFPTNLTSFQFINVDIYGDNSGKNVYFKFFDADSNSAYRIIDINFTGWRTFQFDRASFTQENGSAATMWTGLIGLVLGSPSGGPMDIRFDKVVATNTPLNAVADPFHFLPFENDSAREVLTPNTGDTNIGDYSWDNTLKTDGAVSLRLQFKTGAWAYVMNINTLNAGNYYPTDLTDFTYINMDVYGDGSGKNVYFKFFDNASNSAYVILNIDFTGWKKFQIARTSFTEENGSAATMWTGVIGLVLASPSGGPLDVRFDNVVATDVQYVPPSNVVVQSAALRTITVDGNVADWDLTASVAARVDNSARGRNMGADVRYAWDDTYLYVLIQEVGSAAASQEAGSTGEYDGAPWNYDGVSLFIDLGNGNAGEGIQDFNPWFGFSSTGRSGLWTARINNLSDINPAPLANGSVATSGTFAARNRVIEARIAWADLAATIDAGRQPGGSLISAVTGGYLFGSEPLLIENDYRYQSFIGGSQYGVPSGTDINSRDVRLIGINAARGWTLY